GGPESPDQMRGQKVGLHLRLAPELLERADRRVPLGADVAVRHAVGPPDRRRLHISQRGPAPPPASFTRMAPGPSACSGDAGIGLLSVPIRRVPPSFAPSRF